MAPVVHGRVRARGLGGAEQLAGGDVDDREAVGRGRAQRDGRRPGSGRGGAARTRPGSTALAPAVRSPPRGPPAQLAGALSSSAWASQRGPRNSASPLDSGPSCAAHSRWPRWISGLSWSRIAASTGRSRKSSGWRQKNWSSASSPATYTARPRPRRPGAPPHLAQRGDGAGERDDDRRVELADVDAELERVGRDHRAQLAARQPALELAPLLGGVAGAVGDDALGELGVGLLELEL